MISHQTLVASSEQENIVGSSLGPPQCCYEKANYSGMRKWMAHEEKLQHEKDATPIKGPVLERQYHLSRGYAYRTASENEY